MPLDIDLENLRILESWYEEKCDGQWEHHFGVTIESCDNPGWTASFTDMPISTKRLASELRTLLLDHSAQVTTDGTMVRIFAPSLRGCLAAAAKVIGLSKSEN